MIGNIILVCGAVLAVWFVWFVWVMVCARRTFKQRMALIRRPLTPPAAKVAFLDEIQAVSFDKHFWYLMTLRDPYHLYLRALILIITESPES